MQSISKLVSTSWAFQEATVIFSEWLYHYIFLPAMYEILFIFILFSMLLSLIFILAILIDMEWHLLRLWFVFPNSHWCWTSFYVFICHPHIFFSEMSHVFYPISKWSFWILLLSFETYIINKNSLLDMWFVNIFSHNVTCILILFTETFVEQKILILMNSKLSICFL